MNFSHIKSIIFLCFALFILSACHPIVGEVTEGEEQYDNFYLEMLNSDNKENDNHTQETSLTIEKDDDIVDDRKDEDGKEEIEKEDIYIDKKGENKMVVAFFSASGNTKKISRDIVEYYHKKGIEVDLYEIEPSKPYTVKDLDWADDNSRSSKEHTDPSSRPELKDHDFNIDKHDTILLGYPVWWGEAPKIVYTFLESYDFSGKKIYPFVSSHTSSLGKSTEVLKDYTTASISDGKRFVLDDQDNEVKGWLDSLQLEK